MKKLEKPDKFHLERLIQDLRNGRYVIPDFQRDFEWRPWDVVELIKSIFKDYYIGTLLLWKASNENLKKLSCEPIYGFSSKADPEHIVLDGQQRLSALYYAFFAPEKNYPRRAKRYLFFVNLEELISENYEEAVYYEWGTAKILKFLEDRNAQYEQKIFPLSVLGEKSYSWLRWIEGYEKYWMSKTDDKDAVKKDRDKIEKFFEDLITNYEVSYIELDRNIAVAKVCDIFTKINSTGIVLNIFDLLNAVLRPQDIFLKKMWGDVPNGFHVLEAKSLLQTMSILKQGYCAPSYLYYLVPGEKKFIRKPDGSKDSIVLVKTKEEFIELWNLVVERVGNILKIMENPRDFGVISPSKYMPYLTMIPIITAVYIERDKDLYKDKDDIDSKIKKWYWSSIFTKNYSSSVESQMTKDYYEIQEWFKDDSKVPRVVTQCISEIDSLDLKEEQTQSSAIYKAVFNILILKGAKDWNNFKLPEYSVLHDHHIVPSSWGKKRVGKLINSILNRTPLSDKTNSDVINDELPNVYIKKIFEKTKDQESVYKLFESHLISRKAIEILLREDFDENDFVEFIEERERLIKEEIDKLIGPKIIQTLRNDKNAAIDEIEIKVRNFIDHKLAHEHGPKYWKKAITSDIQEQVAKKVGKYLEKTPELAEKDIDDRRRLDFCDVMDYCKIIIVNWNLFADTFKSKSEVEKKFVNFKEYRNIVKHNREMESVVKKEGEAAIEWFDKLLRPFID